MSMETTSHIEKSSDGENLQNRGFEKPSLKERFQSAYDSVFIHEDSGENALELIKSAFGKNGVEKGKLLRGMLTIVKKLSSKELLNEKREAVFDNIPFEIPRTEDGARVLPKVGAGYICTVYELPSTVSEKSYAMGIRKISFESTKMAEMYASKEKAEYEYLKKLFGSIPNLIPEEHQLIFTDFRGKPNYMFLREFVNGPLVDVFEIDRTEFVERLEQNNELRESLRSFSDIIDSNRDTLVEIGMDLIGERNLVFAGDKGKEKLVFLEPHCFDTIATKDDTRKLNRRIDYLEDMLEEVDKKTTQSV